jgi:hypothetical protein
MHDCERPGAHAPIEVEFFFLGVRRLMPPAAFLGYSIDHRKSLLLKGNLSTGGGYGK